MRGAEARDQADAEIRESPGGPRPCALRAQRLTQALAILQVDTVADRVAEGRERREERGRSIRASPTWEPTS